MEVKPGYKQIEVGVIPEDWEVKPLSALGQFKNGINKSSEAFGHGSPFVNLMDVFGVSRITSGDAFGLVETTKAEQKTYDLKRGDVLFIRSSVKPSGVGLTAVVEVDLPKTVYSGFLLRFRDNDALDIGFKRHCFYSEKFRSKLIGASSVSANTNINQDNLKKLLLVLPSTEAEQRAIATALSDVDELLGGLDRLIAKKRDLKQAAMQQLLTSQTRLPGFHGEWEVKRLGTLLQFQVGFPFSSAFFNEKGEGIRLVKNRDLKSDDQVFHYNGMYEEAFVIRDGDVLIGMDGDFLPCQWNKGPALLNQRVGRVVPNTGLNVAFAFYALIEPLKEIEIVTSCTTVKHLSHGDVEGIERPLPPLPEQTAIASVLTEMDGELAVLTQRREKTRTLKQAMMQELLTGKTRLI